MPEDRHRERDLATLVDYWFGEIEPRQWFTVDKAFDQLLSQRFGRLYERTARHVPQETQVDPKAALGAVLALDQLPRNLFRGTPQAFATDRMALEIARAAVSASFDHHLAADERLFLYLPFEHSEGMADQEESVRLISALGNAEYTRYAIAHRDIIARFGRFPHRNEILGRASTPQEIAFLQQPGSRF